MSLNERIYMTQTDYQILGAVAEENQNQELVDHLEDELARAQIVADEEIPGNIVTLHSRVRILDESTSKVREVTIVPPGDPRAGEGYVSVLAPVGAAVIGLCEGQAIDWPMPSGRTGRFRVIEVIHQPEAKRKSLSRR